MGRCKEWAKVVGDDQVDARVLAMRHKDQTYVPKVQQATKPERVMTYRSVSPAAQVCCLQDRQGITTVLGEHHSISRVACHQLCL